MMTITSINDDFNFCRGIIGYKYKYNSPYNYLTLNRVQFEAMKAHMMAEAEKQKN